MPAAATATASFAFDTWEEQPIVDDGQLRVHRTRFTKRWEGEIQGSSDGEMLMVHKADRPAAHCGFELVTVTVVGRTGSFMFHDNAGAGREGGLSVTVISGSGPAS